MRPIKFRQPIYRSNIGFFGWHYWGFIDNEFITPHSGHRLAPSYQFAFSSNGFDVYEGDIIKIDYSAICGYELFDIGEVMFNSDPCLSRIEFGLWTKGGYQPTDFMGEITVLTNIIEQPNYENDLRVW